MYCLLLRVFVTAMNDFYNAVYEAVKRVPRGKVSTYGDIARAVGAPRAARHVGRALHCNPYFGEVPCHRIVFSDGALAQSFAFGGADVQRAMLESEGVAFKGAYTVDMNLCKWEGE